MRTTMLSVLACSCLLAFLPRAQEVDTQEEDPEIRNPFTAMAEDEAKRIDKALQGAWMLMEFTTLNDMVDQEAVQGFFVFHDGYLTVTLQAARATGGFFTEKREYMIQAGAYRYRVADAQLLQTTGMMGFTNAGNLNQLDFQSVLEPQEYQVTVTERDLTLQRTDHSVFRFTKLERQDFPESAVRRLDLMRGGGGELVDDGWGFGEEDR